MSSASNSIESPCIRNCCLNTDDMCIGCSRTLQEIMKWSDSSLEDKQQILLNCQMRKQQAQQSGSKLF